MKISIQKILIRNNIIRNKQQASYVMIALIAVCILIIFIINKPYGNENIDPNDTSLDPTKAEYINMETEKGTEIDSTSTKKIISH